MRSTMFVFITGFLLTFIPLSQADVASPGKHEFGIWSSVSFDTTTLGGLNDHEVKGRKLLLAGLRYERILSEKKDSSFFYTLDVIPLAIAFHSSVQKSAGDLEPNDVYGFGASPIGFMFCFLRNRRVQPQLGLNGGFLYFQKPVPNPVGTSFNFTASGGAGVRISLSQDHAFELGYMFHHISNGRPPVENPSLNTNLLYFGFTFL